MLQEVRLKSQDEVFETPIMQQTAFWSKVKRKLGDDTMAFNFKSNRNKICSSCRTNDSLLSDILIIQQRIDPQHSVAYVPYGPELEPSMELQGVFLEELSESLRSYLPDDCIMIRYDLLWESHWAGESDFYDENGYWIGPPNKDIQELRFNYNTHNWNLKKSTYNILPSNTVFLDLTKTSEQLLGAMKPKTRYNIGLSGRKGVVVKEAGPEHLDIWYDLYKQTAYRNGLFPNDINYFKAVISSKAAGSKSPARVVLLIAEAENKPLAAMFLVMSSKRATYLYGASASHHKEYMASYALQWKGIQLAKENGCLEYDMFGTAPNPNPEHPMYGLYRFKTGFGGHLYHSMGSWDYPFKKDIYEYFVAREMNSQGYYTN